MPIGQDFHAARYVPGATVIAAAGSVDHAILVEMARAVEARADAAREAGQRDGHSGAAAAEHKWPLNYGNCALLWRSRNQ